MGLVWIIQWVPRLVVRHSRVLVVDTVLLISSAMRKLRIFDSSGCASVERILLASSSPYSGSKQSAIGLVFRDQTGRYHHAMMHEKGGVMLCAGALGSPQLLLLSGIGPRPTSHRGEFLWLITCLMSDSSSMITPEMASQLCLQCHWSTLWYKLRA